MWGAIASLVGSAMKDTLISPKDLWLNYENRKAVSAANEYNYQMWLAQNAYNTPVNQMLRLKEAGLNPNLVAGQLASSAAGHVSPANVRRYQADTMDLIGNYQDIRQKDATTDNLRAQTDSTRKNIGISEKKLNMEEKRLDADLLNASNEAHLKGVQFGIANNQLRESRERAEQARMQTNMMRLTMPYQAKDVVRDYQSKDFWRPWNNFWTNFVGTPINNASPFVSAGTSHLYWHRGE